MVGWDGEVMQHKDGGDLHCCVKSWYPWPEKRLAVLIRHQTLPRYGAGVEMPIRKGALNQSRQTKKPFSAFIDTVILGNGKLAQHFFLGGFPFPPLCLPKVPSLGFLL